MVKHIVMWKLADDKNKKDHILLIKNALEGLKYHIDAIAELEVGIDYNQKDQTHSDIVLYSEFKSWNDLSLYQNHPEHLKVVKFLRSLNTEKRVVDFEE